MKRGAAIKSKQGGRAPPTTQELGGEEAQRLRALVESSSSVHTLAPAELLAALAADRPCEGLYSKACKDKQGKCASRNPNCLCNLLPAPGAHRKTGLWAKQSDVVGTLGVDPSTAERKDHSLPVGLKNLGNTCYVNSVLQCLFANTAFRRAVYAAQQPLADEPIVKQLRELFLAMEFGCRDPADPEPLAKALNLDHGVQQDGQEFMKLFLTLLEARFEGQAQLAGVIQGLFRGQSGYRTVCQQCGRPSESSERSDNFYEVDVPVKGFRSLQDSLNSLLAPEWLEGDNAYSCEYCAQKCTASRQLELRQLPPVLCFSLQRFVFDFQRMDRVKVSDKFAFPLALDMGPVINEAGRADLRYDLEAIMVHKGGSATQGHYVAHIKTEGGGAAAPGLAEPSGKRRGKKGSGAADDGAAALASAPAAGGAWWRFDDDSVSELKGGPTSSSDHGGAAKGGAAAAADAGEGGAKKKGGGGRGGGRGGRGGRGRKKGKAASSGSEDEADAASVAEKEDAEMAAAVAASLGGAPPAAAPAAGTAAAAEEIVSSNAYLLVYRRRGADLPMVQLDAAQEAALAAARERLAEEQRRAVKAYAESKRQLVEQQEARQAEVRRTVEAAVKFDEGDTGRFVASEWLIQWADGGVEGGVDAVDNAPLLCPHGKLDPAKVAASRRVSTPAWERMHASCRGGPELAPSDACPVCLAAHLEGIAAHEDTQAQLDRFAAMGAALAAQDGGGVEGVEQDFWISRDWLSKWVGRKDKKNMSEAAPTAAITCPCGASLAPEGAGKKRVAVPAEFWRFLQRGWTAHCAARRQKQLMSKGPGGSGGGGSGVWEAAESEEAAAAAAAEPEVICLDSPTAEGSTKENEEPAGGGRGRRGRNGAVAAAAADAPPKKRGRGAAQQQQQQQQQERDGNGVEVVMLDADSDGVEVVEATEAPSADAGAAAAGRSSGASEALREFAVGTPDCEACASHLAEASRALKSLQDRLGEEKADLAHLADRARLPPALAAGAEYRLVPRSFLDRWRGYMQQAGKRTVGSATKADQIVQAPSLVEALRGVLCECHPDGVKEEDGGGTRYLLGYPPPAAVNRRGRWGLADGDAPIGGGGAADGCEPSLFELVTPEEWQLLAMYYGPDAEAEGSRGRKRARAPAEPVTEAMLALVQHGLVARFVVDTPAGGDASPGAGTAGEQPAPAPGGRPVRGRAAELVADAAAAAADSSSDAELEEAGERTLVVGDATNPYRRARKPPVRQGAAGSARFETDPPLCQLAVASREAAVRTARLTYSGEQVMVEVVQSAEEAVAASEPGGGAERKSKRARKGRVPITVDSTMTLQVLRNLVFQELGVHPRNAQLFLRGAPMAQDGDATLADAEVFPGDEIKVVDSGEHDATDYASLFPPDAKGVRRPREAERGFTGTALTGLAPAATGGGASGEEGSGGGASGGIDIDAELAAAAAAGEDAMQD